MTAIIEVLLSCDGGKHCNSHEPYGVDYKHSTARDQRLSAAIDGWTYSGGKDYCPECSQLRKLKARGNNDKQ